MIHFEIDEWTGMLDVVDTFGAEEVAQIAATEAGEQWTFYGDELPVFNLRVLNLVLWDVASMQMLLDDAARNYHPCMGHTCSICGYSDGEHNFEVHRAEAIAYMEPNDTPWYEDRDWSFAYDDEVDAEFDASLNVSLNDDPEGDVQALWDLRDGTLSDEPDDEPTGRWIED